jgi:uncharacterized surface anchored protein
MKGFIVGFFSIVFAVTVFANEKEGKTAENTGKAANVALSGTVLDSDSGELLAGVEVTLEGTGSKTYTDFDGQFSFKKLQPGEYKLITNYISYKKCSETLKVDAGKNEVTLKIEISD